MKQLSQRVAKHAASLALAASLCVALAGCGGTGAVPEDIVMRDVSGSDVVAEGAVPSDFVNESPYELVDFEVEGQERGTAVMFGVEVEVATVQFSAVIENESFRTSLSGVSTYVLEGDAWAAMGQPDLISATTVPLKGVDLIAEEDLADAEYSVSNFQSTFEESDGAYSSTASQDVTYDFWFATDTATNVRSFKFDNERGWVPQGEAQASGMATEWKLAGKSFSFHEAAGGQINGPSGDLVFTLSFGSGASADELTAAYSVDFDNAKESTKSNTYYDVDLSGECAGTPVHGFGEDDFSIEFNDAAAKATLECSNERPLEIAGTGTVNSIRVNLFTQSPYRHAYGADYNLELYCIFSESA